MPWFLNMFLFQVITRLEKAVNCSHKEAVEFATTVDREGRTCVYAGALEVCQKLAAQIQVRFVEVCDRLPSFN